MATIDDLKQKALGDLSSEELMDRLREIRLSRRTPKRKKGSSKKVEGPKTVTEAIGKMSKDQAEQLLKILESKK
jgi:hypothetical protein